MCELPPSLVTSCDFTAKTERQVCVILNSDLLEQFGPVSRRNLVRVKQSPHLYPPGPFRFIFTSIVYCIFRFLMVFATPTYYYAFVIICSCFFSTHSG